MTGHLQPRTEPAPFFAEDDGLQQEQLVKRAFAAAEHAWEDAYETGKDEDAVAYLEMFAVPLFRQLHGLGSSDIDIDYWVGKAKDDFGDELSQEPSFDIDVACPDIEDFYRDVQERFDRDRFDYLVGIYSGGIPVLYTASSHLDGEDILLRYSHRERDDEEVIMTDEMEERMDLKGSRVLLLDDITQSGETMRQVGKYILDSGVVELKGMTYMTGELVDLRYKPGFTEDIYTGWQEVEMVPLREDRPESGRESIL